MGSSVPRFGATGLRVTRVALLDNKNGTMLSRANEGFSTNGIHRLT